MKLLINKRTLKRFKEFTDRDVIEMNVLQNGQVVARIDQSENFTSGEYTFDFELVYKNKKSETLKNQTIEIRDKDKIINIGYTKFEDILLAIVLNVWFWVGAVLSLFIAKILGTSGIFLIAVCATFATTNPMVYKTKGITALKFK